MSTIVSDLRVVRDTISMTPLITDRQLMVDRIQAAIDHIEALEARMVKFDHLQKSVMELATIILAAAPSDDDTKVRLSDVLGYRP